MILRIAIIIALGLLPTASADALLLQGVSRASSGGGAATGQSCPNSLDFSQACNSQYIGVVI